MRRAIRTMNVPVNGAGAFAPMPLMTPTASTGGLVHTEGHPGTLLQASPRPEAIPPISMDPRTQQSAAGAPNAWRPTIYVAHADNMAPPVPIEIDNVMPMPIPNVQRIPRQATYKVRLGGQTATAWPRPIIRWPTYGPSSS